MKQLNPKNFSQRHKATGTEEQSRIVPEDKMIEKFKD